MSSIFSVYFFFFLAVLPLSSSVKPQSSRRFFFVVSLLPKATGEGSNFPHSLPFHVITMIPITFIRRISYWEKDNLNLKHNGNPQKKKSKFKKKKKKNRFFFPFLRMWLCEFKQEGENHGRISNDDKLMHTLYVSLERENLMATATTEKKK